MRANDMGCLRLSSKQGVAGSSPAGPIYQLLSAMRNHKRLCSEIGGLRHVSLGVTEHLSVVTRSNANDSRIRPGEFGNPEQPRVYPKMFGPMHVAAIDGVSMAHNRILFVVELPQFPQNVLISRGSERQIDLIGDVRTSPGQIALCFVSTRAR